jgi:prepilin-type N-terminal cleavage/methylation domain-containing protein
MKKAFTFTEIMLALAIIGFITTMILPIFFNTYGNKVVSAQLKKTCTLITNATKHIMTDEHSNDIGSLTDDFDADAADDDDGVSHKLGFYYSKAGVKTSNSEQGAQYFLNNYFRYTLSNCGSGGSKTCVADSYRTPDNVSVGTVPANFYCIKTTNDSTICMRYKEKDNAGRIEVLIDVNATDRPNITGSDVYVMYITDDGQLKDLDENEANCNALSSIDGENIIKYSAGCFHKIVIKSWNMREQ